MSLARAARVSRLSFAVVLLQVLNVGLVPMVVIVVGLAFFQYYTSDKLALAGAGAKVVSREDARTEETSRPYPLGGHCGFA